MITEQITKNTIENWKRLFGVYAPSLLPNRKTGEELDSYFRSKYEYSISKSARWKSVVKANVLENDCFRGKLMHDTTPQIAAYSVDGVMVGIDLVSGYFQVESEDIGKMSAIYDDLFVYRGLDSEDIKNYVLVGQYIELTQRQKISRVYSANPVIKQQ